MVGQEQQATVEQTPTNCLLDQKTLENAILAQAYAHKQASKEQTMILQATHLTVLGRVSPKNQEIIDESKPSDQLLFLDEDDLWAPAYKVQSLRRPI